MSRWGCVGIGASHADVSGTVPNSVDLIEFFFLGCGQELEVVFSGSRSTGGTVRQRGKAKGKAQAKGKAKAGGKGKAKGSEKAKAGGKAKAKATGKSKGSGKAKVHFIGWPVIGSLFAFFNQRRILDTLAGWHKGKGQGKG